MTTRPSILDQAATLAELTRSRVLQLLQRHELTVSELCSILQMPQSTVSRHLKVLLESGWLSARREGTSHLYRFDHDGLEAASQQLWQLISSELQETAAALQDAQRLEAVLRQRRSRSEAFFSATAERWDHLRAELFGQRFDLLALLALLDPELTVGDLGCGTGQTAEALAPFVAKVVAVDGSEAMLAAGRERLARFDNVELRQGELEDLPLAAGQLNAAVLFLALHHLPEPARVLAEARRVLAPGGRLLVVDMLPHDREDFRQQMGHVWLGFDDDQMQRLMLDAGLRPRNFQALPAESDAKGPSLFIATATAPPGTVLGDGVAPKLALAEVD